jgi:hypothetical protein
MVGAADEAGAAGDAESVVAAVLFVTDCAAEGSDSMVFSEASGVGKLDVTGSATEAAVCVSEA